MTSFHEFFCLQRNKAIIIRKETKVRQTLKAIDMVDEPKTCAKVAKYLGMSNRGTNHRLKKLEDLGLIEKRLRKKFIIRKKNEHKSKRNII